jgi:hypothetical protein
MSGCALRRWGPGTTKEKIPNTEEAKKLESELHEIIRRRQLQDEDCFPPLRDSSNNNIETHTPRQKKEYMLYNNQ